MWMITEVDNHLSQLCGTFCQINFQQLKVCLSWLLIFLRASVGIQCQLWAVRLLSWLYSGKNLESCKTKLFRNFLSICKFHHYTHTSITQPSLPVWVLVCHWKKDWVIIQPSKVYFSLVLLFSLRRVCPNTEVFLCAAYEYVGKVDLAGAVWILKENWVGGGGVNIHFSEIPVSKKQ